MDKEKAQKGVIVIKYDFHAKHTENGVKRKKEASHQLRQKKIGDQRKTNKQPTRKYFQKQKKRQKMRQDTGVICSSLEWNKYTHTIHEITEDKKTDFLLYSLSVMFKVEMANKRKQYQTML